MPIIKRAIKKLRHDRKRTIVNKKKREALHQLVKEMRKKPSKKILSDVYKAADKAVKINLIHKNKAARLKSRLSKLLVKKI